MGGRELMDLFNRLTKLEKSAALFGFKWDHARQIMRQIKSECHEVEEHLTGSENESRERLQEEIGDLLHAVFSLCVFTDFDPEETLKKSLDKFESRFKKVQSLTQEKGLKSLKGKSFQELMLIWEQAKRID